MSLGEWREQGILREHQPSRQEIAALLEVVGRDLHDARTPGLSADARLTIAYNAALQCATAALAAAGYRAVREAHHVRVIESLEFTIGWPAEEIRTLERFRRQRHRAWYERAYITSEAEAACSVSRVRIVSVMLRASSWSMLV